MDLDEEMPTMGLDDMSDDGCDGAGALPTDTLPDGIKKEIIAEVQGWRKPKKGDEVTVHYVGTLESDGSEFDSSRSRGTPFVFTLGKGQVIKGWDLGVATMKKGEIAKFTLAPQFAYGESGSPPKIPANATLVFEVELISWASKDDLFGDEGVIKTQLEEGKGWKNPKSGDEVKISVQAVAADGSTIEERNSIEYIIGSSTLGDIGKACDKALVGLKKNEKIALRCTKEYAYGDKHPDGATINLTLEEIYETKDVSFARDKSLMKKTVKEGEGYDTPKDANKVTLSVTAGVNAAGAALASFTPAVLEFVAGNGEVCDALECAVAEMKKGEQAVITAVAADAKEARLGLQDVQDGQVVLTVELQNFDKGKETWDMSEEEKLEYGSARKEVGSALLKVGRLNMALQRYKKVSDMFSYVDNFKEDNKERAKALKLACESNKAVVYLKLKSWSEALSTCNTVLMDDKSNIKAYYRRAQAHLNLKNFLDCIADCKKVVELDPSNKEARTLLKQAQAGQKEEDKKAKGLFANMCKALGKGPIPEPFKADKIGDFSDEELEAASTEDGTVE